MLKMGLQIICQLRIGLQINKFNDKCKSKKACILTIMSGNTFVCHSSTALYSGRFFKKQVCDKSLTFTGKLTNSSLTISH